MGGPNLEIFKFALYIFTPIGAMLYFGTNLDNRFSVPDFWPKPSQTHRVPFEREEISAELERMKAKRLFLRERRLAGEMGGHQPRNGEVDRVSASASSDLDRRGNGNGS